MLHADNPPNTYGVACLCITLRGATNACSLECAAPASCECGRSIDAAIDEDASLRDIEVITAGESLR